MRALVSLASSRARALFAAGLLAFAAPACGQEGLATTTSSSTEGGGGDGAGGSGTGGTGGGGAGVPGKPLKIADWNVRNFFDTKKDDPSNGEEIVLNATDYKTKRQTIGTTLKDLDADLVVLAEVEHESTLDDLNEAELDGVYTTRRLIEGNDYRGIDIGVMSKLPLDSVVSHKDDTFKADVGSPPIKYSRDCLEIHLTFNGRHVVLLGVHFRSKAGEDMGGDKRLAEAKHTREIADGIAAKDPSAAIVILGDYNDLPDSPPWLAIKGAAPGEFGAAAAHLSGTPYSYNYMGKLELIDHQMSNPVLYPMLDPSSVILKHGEGIDSGGKYASDHAPVMATYLVK